MQYAVDIQGFKQHTSTGKDDDYVVKELAINPLFVNKDPIVVLFRPPYSWKRFSSKYKSENAWLEQYYHGLSWDSGTMPYIHVGAFLREHLGGSTKVYVVGTIRKLWLERFRFSVTDITEIGYSPDKLRKLATVCSHHDGSYKVNCALHNVKRMRQYIESEKKRLESII